MSEKPEESHDQNSVKSGTHIDESMSTIHNSKENVQVGIQINVNSEHIVATKVILIINVYYIGKPPLSNINTYTSLHFRNQPKMNKMPKL